MFSGSWSLEMRMWFSLSNRVFLGSCSCLRGSGQRSLSRMWAHLFCGHTGCCSFRDVLWPRPLACFPSDLVEGRTRDSVLVMCPLGSSFLVNTSRAEVSASRLSTGYACCAPGVGVLWATQSKTFLLGCLPPRACLLRHLGQPQRLLLPPGTVDAPHLHLPAGVWQASEAGPELGLRDAEVAIIVIMILHAWATVTGVLQRVIQKILVHLHLRDMLCRVLLRVLHFLQHWPWAASPGLFAWRLAARPWASFLFSISAPS